MKISSIIQVLLCALVLMSFGREAMAANVAPTVATPAAASPNPVTTGTSTALSVLGADDGGAAALTYTWDVNMLLAPAPVTFSANGTNAARNATATFTKAGWYLLRATIRDVENLTVTSSVWVEVRQAVTSLVNLPASASVSQRSVTAFRGDMRDQFGGSFLTQPLFTWTKTAGGTLLGSTSYVMEASGSDIWNTSDGFRFAHQSLTGDGTITAKVESLVNTDNWSKAGVMMRDGLAANAVNAMTNVTAASGALFQRRVAIGGVTVNTIIAGQAAPKWVRLQRVGNTFTGSYSPDGVAWTVITSETIAMGPTLYVGLASTAHNTARLTQAVFSNVTVTTPSTTAVAPDSPWVQQDIGTVGLAGSSSYTPSTKTFTVTAAGTDIWNNADGFRFVHQPLTGDATLIARVVTQQNTHTWAKAGLMIRDGLAADAREAMVNVTAAAGVLFQYRAAVAGTTLHQDVTPVEAPIKATRWLKLTRSGNQFTGFHSSDGQNWTQIWSTSVTMAATVNVGLAVSSHTTAALSTATFDNVSIYQGSGALAVPLSPWRNQDIGTTVPAGSTRAALIPGVFLADMAPGSVTLTSSASGRTANSAVTVVNAAPTVVVAANATPSPATGTTTALKVVGGDDAGEQGLIYTWATTGIPPAAVTFSANGTNAAKNVTATFTKAGTYNFQVSMTDAGSLTATSSVAVTVNQTITTVVVTPASATIATGATQTYVASARDQFATTLTTQPTFTWTVAAGGTISTAGLFTAGGTAGGPHTVTAAAGGRSGTATVTITSGGNTPPTVATAAAATPSPVIGTTTVLSALGADNGGEPALIYTWATTGTPPAAVTFSANGTNAAKSSTATFTKAGTYGFQVTIRDAGALTVTSSVSVVVNATLTTVVVTPASATVNTGSTQAFAASGRDQFATTLATQPTFTWTVSGGGTISTAGLFSATTAGGPFTVTATSGTKSGTASVTVTANTPPTVATAASASPSPATGTTTVLSALGADNGGEPALIYTWATTGTPPAAVTFSANGTNAAKTTTATFTKAGTYGFQVTIRDAGSLTVTSSVSVVVNATLTTVVVTPASATVNTGSTQAFAASGRDQFATTLTTQPTFTWTVGGGGTISTAGLFSATTVGGPFTVTATSGTTNGTASVTVSAPVNTPPTVTLTSPANNTVVVPGTVTLTATASDSDGTVAKVEFYNGSTKLGEDLSSPYSYAWASVPVGTYPLMAQAIDNLGAITSTAYIQITVGTNAIPVADFSLLNTAGSFTVTFDGGLSSDPDGDMIASYLWDFTGAVASGQPTSSTAAKPTVVLNSAGSSFPITLRVTDNRGAQSNPLSRTYTAAEISGGNQPPPQESDDKKIIYVGDETDFSLDLSNDRALSANWTQNSASGGKILFFDNRASTCDAWKPQFNDVFDFPQCGTGIRVKGSQPGKVTISVTSAADTAPTQSGVCGQNGSSVSKTFEVTVLPRPEPPPKMPLGSKYRRVDAHGIPMPDPSPTGEGESDRVPNMAYTDMFSLSPTYATTDLSVPVEGGELTLEFRRTMSIKSRNYNTDLKKLNVTYPVDDLLGLGWDTNLGSRVIITERKDKNGTPYLVADVTDETGGSYGYRITGSGTSMVFLADLAHSFNNEAIKAKLTINASSELVLTKPHGTQVTYQQIPRMFFAPFTSAGDSCGGSADLHKEIYYRVKSITDRNGNRLDFAYNAHWAVTATGGVPDSPPAPTTAPDGDPIQNGPNGDLVVRRITFFNANTAHQLSDTKRVLRIRASWHKEFAESHWMMPGIPTATGRDSGWRIDKVIDPLDRETVYSFANYTEAPGTGNTFTFTTGSAWLGATIQVSGVNYPGLPGVLTTVTRPAAATFVESTGSGNNDSTSSQIPEVRFTYDLVDLRDTLLDPANPPQMDGNIGINRFIAPKTITDARGHVTSMTYSPENQTQTLDGWFPVSYYPSLGSFVWQQRIRLKTMSTQEDGTATFNMAAFPNAFVTNPGAGTIDLTTDVTDVRGVKSTFKFAQKITPVPNEVGAALYVTKFERLTDGTSGNGNTGKAVFEFSDPFGLPDPNGNLTKVTDMSGNVIQFVYRSGVTGDTFDQGMTVPANALNAYYNPSRYMAFNKPAKRIVDPGGLNLVTEYRYDKDKFNKQSDEYDAEGIRTRYVFDTKGNRTEVQEGVTGTTTLVAKRTTKYAYAVNGFISQVTDPDNRVTTHVQTFNTAAVTVPAGVADSAGETAPTLQAYKQVVSTVKGYANELTLATTSVSDALGNNRWITDPRGNSTRSYYDALNRSVKVKSPAVVNALGATVTSVSETFYDLSSNVRKQTDDEGNATVSTYDRMNRATQVRVRMTNPLQNDAADLLTKTNYRHGSDTGTASAGLPRFTEDANGRRTDYAYDNLLRLTTTTFPTVTLPGGSTTRYTMTNTYGKNSGSGAFAYWSGWQPVRVKDKRGYYTDSTFDKIYRPTRVVQRASTTPPALDSSGTPPVPGTGEPTTETFYTKTHKPIRTVTWSENWAGSASNQTTWVSYDSFYRVTLSVVDGNNGNGTVTAVTAPPTFIEDGLAYHTTNAGANSNALMNATAYDKSGNALTVRDQLGRQSTNTYDGANRVTQVVQPSMTVIDPKGYNTNNTSVSPTTTYTYDPNGNRTIVEDPNHTKTQTTYDARNRATQVVVDLNNDGTYSNVVNGADIVTATRYNLVGMPVLTTDSRGYATDNVYDRAYRLTIMRQPQVSNAQAVPATNVRPEITRTYDKNGNLLTIQDARQKIHAAAVKTVNTYDELNRLRTTVAASGDTAALTTENQYDANGNVTALLCLNSAGSGGTQTSSYTYDAYNRKLTETLPAVADALQRRTTWTYYRHGAIRTTTDAKSQVHENEFDRAERLVRSRHKLSGGATDETRTFTLSKTGKPLTIADKSGTTTQVYDNHDRVVSESRATTGQTAYTVQNAYDAIGQRTQVIYPVTNRTILNHHDRAGRLTRVNDGAKNTDYTYDVAGNRLTITEPNGVVTTNTYDALNRCTISNTRKGTTTVSDFTYGFDLVGNRVTVTENIASQGSRTIAYTYDAKYQITGESWSGYSNTYVYDLAGNRLTKTNVVGATTTTTTSTYDVLNRLLTSTTGGVGTTYTYDLCGNQITQVTGANTHTFTWDVHNRLLNVVQGTNALAATYDYRTRRESVAVNGATPRYFRYDGGVSFHELLAGALQVEFLRGADMGGGIGSILYSDRTMAGGVEETFAYNPAVGHVTALTNSAGATVDSDRYDAFGNIVGTPVGTSLNNRLANTKERNVIGTLVLDNHGFRYYNPATGRYINRDPLGYPDGLNSYVHVGNNPVNRIDPHGLFWGFIVDAVTAISDTVDYARGNISGTEYATRMATTAISVGANLVTGGAGGLAVRAAAKAFRAADKANEVVAKAENAAATATAAANGDAMGVVEGLAGAKGGGKAAKKTDSGDGGAPTPKPKADAAENGKADSAGTCAGGSCFVAGTLVATPNGKRAIETLNSGDKVWAWEDHSGRIGVQSILQTFTVQSDHRLTVYFGKTTLVTTDEHPFWVDGNGWTEAQHLNVGDRVLTIDGTWERVLTSRREDVPTTVYNIEVDRFHSYFVGEGAVVVHNLECEKEFGSYTNTFASGKTYHGQGDKKRSQTSAKEQEAANNDQHVATDWTPAPDRREAMKQESRRLDADGGKESDSNYNKIESPGKKYRTEDGELPPPPTDDGKPK